MSTKHTKRKSRKVPCCKKRQTEPGESDCFVCELSTFWGFNTVQVLEADKVVILPETIN